MFNKIRLLLYNFEDKTKKRIMKLFFWILGWKNIEDFKIVYYPNLYMRITMTMTTDNIPHYKLEIMQIGGIKDE